MSEASMLWTPFEDGTTLGTQGSERGVILQDEEHSMGARLTLEQGGQTAPYAITCGIYGFMVHTTWAGSEAEAASKYQAMKDDFHTLLEKDLSDDVYEFIKKY